VLTYFGCRNSCRSSSTCSAVLRPSSRWPQTSPNPLAKLKQYFTQRFYHATLCWRGIRCRRMSICPSVCLSVTSRHCIETSGQIELVLKCRLPPNYPRLCYKEIWVPPNTRALPSGTLSQTLDLENFSTACILCCEQNSLSLSTVELVDNTCMTIDGRVMGLAVYYKSISCNPVSV